MPRYFAPITIEELAQKIYNEAKEKHYDYEPKEWEEEVSRDRDGNILSTTASKIEAHGHNVNWIEMVGDDLTKKCKFDTENVQANNEWDDLPNVYGFHTLGNRFTFVGVGAGGDWEVPITFIVYWDGKKLRGYIPTEGNPWNTDTKEAYGNNEELDEKNFIKRFVTSKEDKKAFKELTYFDIHSAIPTEAEILEDINKRIKHVEWKEIEAELNKEAQEEEAEYRAVEVMVSEVQKAYVWIRENNHTIPDEVLDLMKDAAIRELTGE